MALSHDLWQANEDLAIACLEHPFIQGISNGTLPQNQFVYYIGQDTFFLKAFARAYSLAAAKAIDWEGFSTFHALAGGVIEELRVHQGYTAKWQIDLQTVELGVITRRYTDFLTAVAWGSESGLTAVAMAPCLRLYAFLGQELARNGIKGHQYADWIYAYSDPKFEELAQKLESLVDRYASATPLAQSTYRYAMKCEQDFFQASLEVES